MELLGLIKGFGSYNTAQLEQMKQDLNLQMPLQAIEYTAAHYRTKEKRDPQIDELIAWDRFFTHMSSLASAIAPMELLTNDAFVAQTYADMMTKRSLCHPNAKVPCCFGEAIQIATTYLERIGRYKSPLSVAPILERCEYLPYSIAEQNVFSPETSDFRLRLLSHQAKKESPNDYIVIFMRSANQTVGVYQAAMGELLAAPAVTNQIVNLQMIDQCGLLKAILSICAGAWINLSCLSKTGESVPLSLLTEGYEGAYLARIPQESMRDIHRFSVAKGIQAIYFADALSMPLLRITRVNKQTFSVDAAFLRALPHLSTVSASMAIEHAEKERSITVSSGDTFKNPYFNFTSLTQKSDTKAIGDALVANALSESKENIFLHSLYTALAPICELALCGCEYTKQVLSVGISVPYNAYESNAAGDVAAAILGIYRAQAELAIPSYSNQIQFANVSAPKTSVFSVSKGYEAIPNKLQCAGNSLYFVSIPTDKDGLPVFPMLRKLLSEIATWANSGKLVSATVLASQSPTDALTKMSTKKLTCHLTDNRIASEGALPLAFLIESKFELPIARIGAVVEKEVSEEKLPQETILPSSFMIWSEKTKITVLASEKDHYANMLVAFLNRSGADAELFIFNKDASGPLSRSILLSNYLLLCENVVLPDTQEIRFALDIMKQAGGKCIAFGETDQAADFYLPNGLAEADFNIICGK